MHPAPITKALLTLLVGSLLATLGAAPAGASNLWAVGDGAYSGNNDDAVANLINSEPADQLLYLGDVYETGTAAEFANYYQPTFGRFKAITRPTPGNHEWPNRTSGYDPYWGQSFTSPHYYSFDSGGWHLVSLNSEESFGEGSAQLSWLRADLASHPGNCTIAYWHRPRYSDGSHGDQSDTEPLWQALAGHASMVFNGHDHDYERFKPINGITEFVVGTGGKSLYPLNSADTRLAASNGASYGALRLSLIPSRADFSFKSAAGAVLDAGSVACIDQVYPPKASAPTLTLTLKHKRLRLRHRSNKLRVRFNLSQQATVALQIQRKARGKYRTVKSKSLSLDAGANTVTIARSGLRPGLYRLALLASDTAGNSSRPASARLRVAR